MTNQGDKKLRLTNQVIYKVLYRQKAPYFASIVCCNYYENIFRISVCLFKSPVDSLICQSERHIRWYKPCDIWTTYFPYVPGES